VPVSTSWLSTAPTTAPTPAIECSVIEFGGERLVIERGDDEKSPLYAPRRTVLDPILVDAARETGATFCFGTPMVDLLRGRSGVSPEVFRSSARVDVAATLERVLGSVSPSIAAGARAGSMVGPLRSFPGHVGQFRRPFGDGWALVGDAGYFKDPVAAHGQQAPPMAF
jgi:flavin-dependent dehydrogenase